MTEESLPDAAAPPALPQAAEGGGTARGARFWAVTVAAGLTVALTASLGQWQLGRAAQKNALAAQRDAREALPALGLPALASLSPTAPEAPEAAELHDRAATLRGLWVPEATVFLENRTMAGRVGFLVVTPLRLEGLPSVLLVQRGWVPRSFEDRTALPQVPTSEYPVEVSGRLAPPPSKLYEFEGGAQGQIRQNIDLEAFAQEWSLPLLPLTLQQGAPEAPAGAAPEASPEKLLRDWPRVGHDVHKHYGYALQWFGLCGLLIVLYVWFQFIAPRRRRR